ncbi:MAG: hypothetical protein LAO05_13700 [Acidobacteriia bacterium]|nr:hypothetical protein [Terriglobia bacterium]
MRRLILILLLLVVPAVAALADELTAAAVITALKLGATPEAVTAQINNPANTVAQLTPADLANLKAANVPEAVVHALMAKASSPAPTPMPPTPDNPKLVDVVRMVKSGLSEPVVLEQLRRSGEAFQLTSNDVVYLKNAGVPESVIAFLVTNKNFPLTTPTPTTPPAPTLTPTPTPEPKETTIEGIVLYKPTFMQKNRSGRLIFKEDEVQWVDAVDPKESFSFHMAGVEKVWFTCQARPTESFCYQLNIQIVKGARYRFKDVKQESGSNEAVKAIETWIKKHFPAVPWGPPDVSS